MPAKAGIEKYRIQAIQLSNTDTIEVKIKWKCLAFN
jgi:hypothetical protein